MKISQCRKCGVEIMEPQHIRQARCAACERERYRNYKRTHRWYSSYRNAKTRCTNPKNNSFMRYGGRGIRFNLSLEETERLWFRDRAEFMRWPSLDRIDVDAHYSFDNCRFIEMRLNASMRRDPYTVNSKP